MLDELYRLASNHVSRNKHSRDSILGGGAVEPERHSINNLAHEDTWDAAVYSDELRIH